MCAMQMVDIFPCIFTKINWCRDYKYITRAFSEILQRFICILFVIQKFEVLNPYFSETSRAIVSNNAIKSAKRLWSAENPYGERQLKENIYTFVFIIVRADWLVLVGTAMGKCVGPERLGLFSLFTMGHATNNLL